MNLLSSLPLAMSVLPFGDLDFAPRELIPIVAIVMPFLFVVTILLMKHINDTKARQLQHETIRIALEKGQPLPPELLNVQVVTVEKPKGNDRRTGLILIAVGTGLFFFLGGVDIFWGHTGGGIQWVGLIPGLIGVAMLVNWVLERSEKKDNKN